MVPDDTSDPSSQDPTRFSTSYPPRLISTPDSTSDSTSATTFQLAHQISCLIMVPDNTSDTSPDPGPPDPPDSTHRSGTPDPAYHSGTPDPTFQTTHRIHQMAHQIHHIYPSHQIQHAGSTRFSTSYPARWIHQISHRIMVPDTHHISTPYPWFQMTRLVNTPDITADSTAIPVVQLHTPDTGAHMGTVGSGVSVGVHLGVFELILTKSHNPYTRARVQ